MSLIRLVFSNGNKIEEREVIHDPRTRKDNEFIFYEKKYRHNELDGHYRIKSSYSHTTLYVDFINRKLEHSSKIIFLNCIRT